MIEIKKTKIVIEISHEDMTRIISEAIKRNFGYHPDSITSIKISASGKTIVTVKTEGSTEDYASAYPEG